MAKENEEAAANEQIPVSTEVLGVISALSGLNGGEQAQQDIVSGLKDSETTKKLQGLLNENKPLDTATTGPEEEEEEEETTDPENEEEEETTDSEEEEEEGAAGEEKLDKDGKPIVAKKTAKKKEVALEIESPLFGGKKKIGKGKKAAEPVFEKIEDAYAYVKKNFGQEIKDVKDLPKFFTSAETWRKAATKLPEIEKKNIAMNRIFEEMPATLLDAVKVHFEGGKWEDVIAKPRFDYNIPVEKQDEKALVNHYFPGKFVEADFEDEAKKDALDIAKQASKDKFQSEKTTFEQKRADTVTKAKTTLANRKNSVASSVKVLKESFPDLNEADSTEVMTLMESGDIAGLFLNADGTYKPEAAEMLMLAKHGKSVILQFMKMAENAGETKANEDLLSRGSDKPKKHKGGADKTVNKDVVKYIGSLTSGANKKRTY